MRLHRFSLVAMVALLAGASQRLAAQTDTTRPPTASFIGRVLSTIDSTPVRSADIRLVFLDSVRRMQGPRGRDSLELFADSTRSRVGVTDSNGAFAVRRIE